ncbi:MAG TPA: hypothetical protein VFE53_06615 [Mucilaginibacter sp.]|jgi:hypothetical protein|nr:hypothetical protein [Mucilaginibacter sp.]
MIDINFDGLFSIELLHKYFTDQLFRYFSIAPTAKTLAVLNGRRVLIKNYYNKLYAAVQSNAGKPFIAIEEGLQMTFFLSLNDPVFFNYTNLSGAFAPSEIFYFTNRNNNETNGKSFLSAPIAAYNSATSYAPGDLAANGANVVYRAISSNNSGNQHPLTDTNYWVAIDNNAYASGSDVLQYFPSVSTYTFSSPQAVVAISVLGYNSGTGDYSLPVLANTINFTKPVASFDLDLSALAPGKYSLSINGAQQWIYVNNEISITKPFAVIDIFNQAAPASCNLLSGAGTLLSPLYSLYFLNRATLWRYVLPTGETGGISDNASTYTFATLSNNITSTTPIPLSDALLNFKLTINGNPISPIPCADAQRLTSLTQGGDTYACSEIYLNY